MILFLNTYVFKYRSVFIINNTESIDYSKFICISHLTYKLQDNVFILHHNTLIVYIWVSRIFLSFLSDSWTSNLKLYKTLVR